MKPKKNWVGVAYFLLSPGWTCSIPFLSTAPKGRLCVAHIVGLERVLYIKVWAKCPYGTTRDNYLDMMQYQFTMDRNSWSVKLTEVHYRITGYTQNQGIYTKLQRAPIRDSQSHVLAVGVDDRLVNVHVRHHTPITMCRPLCIVHREGWAQLAPAHSSPSPAHSHNLLNYTLYSYFCPSCR